VTVADRIRAAAELLEAIADDRALLAAASDAERTRLLRAAGRVSRPDAADRRKLVKATKRDRKAAKVERAERVLAATGIRALRREPVFVTPAAGPRLFAPAGFAPEDVLDADDAPAVRRAAVDARNCYVCKRDYTALHHFYDQLCPPCAARNFAKRTETADLRGRVALLTGGPGEDRLPGGDQAAARRGRR
jgi:hypothetical protein